MKAKTILSRVVKMVVLVTSFSNVIGLSVPGAWANQKPRIAVLKKAKHRAELNLRLCEAARNGALSQVKALVKQGANVNTHGAKRGDRMTPLMGAAEGDYVKTMTYLLAKGALINAKDGQGNTALHTAVDEGSAKAVKLLLKHGANYRLKNIYGSTPYWLTTRDEMPADYNENLANQKMLKAQMAKDKRPVK